MALKTCQLMVLRNVQVLSTSTFADLSLTRMKMPSKERIIKDADVNAGWPCLLKTSAQYTSHFMQKY